MTVLILGGTGATGRVLVQQMLDRGIEVRAIVRAPDRLPQEIRDHALVRVIPAGILEMADAELADAVRGCDAVASCLGHNLTMQGIFGQPRKLVTYAVQRIFGAIQANRPARPVRFVLMNTAGNSNRDLSEPLSVGERCMLHLIRRLIPPQADNECAADYLRTQIPHDAALEWVVVRPDTLTNEDAVTDYEVVPSPTRSALFNPGHTSRINVAHCMANLLTDDESWHTWRGKMPVIYNQDFRSPANTCLSLV
jgi:nucleoside-diphosphate-sugar epimerase